MWRVASRCVGLLGVLVAAAAALRWASAGVGASGPAATGAGELDALLLRALLPLAWACLAWLALTTVVLAAATGAGPVARAAARFATAVAPLSVRHGIAVALGAAVVTAAPAAASAALPPRPPAAAVAVDLVDRPAPGPAAGTAQAAAAAPGWTPDRPAAAARRTCAPGLHLVTTPPARAGGDVVVRRGDTLWAIAARALGPDASAAETAAAWPRWFAANRDVIDDPALLLPGQRLRPPAP